MHLRTVNSISALSSIAVVAAFVGCTPAVSYPQEEYRTKMATIGTGISKGEFLKFFPKAEVRGAKSYPEGSVDVLEVVVYRYHFGPTAEPEWFSVPGGQVKKIWFYFFKDSLVQYGQPNDWPDKPNLILETRHK